MGESFGEVTTDSNPFDATSCRTCLEFRHTITERALEEMLQTDSNPSLLVLVERPDSVSWAGENCPRCTRVLVACCTIRSLRERSDCHGSVTSIG
jgi:hypothetical protein